MNSFGGKIQEIPEIFVDNFENALECVATAYFLSHFHSDHIGGLYTDQLFDKLERQKNIFIYAHELTAAIIKFEHSKLVDYVRPLQMGVNSVTVPKVDSDEVIYLNVTLIPAGHCLGSTMFLFETISTRVLYTGDFRIRSNDLSKYRAFHNENGDVIHLDALYVDTTFNNEQFEHFPKRSESVEEAVDIIQRWLSQGLTVLLHTSARYGYEYVFNEIYKRTKMRVYVRYDKWKFYSTIPHLVPSVTNDYIETKIFEKNNLSDYVLKKLENTRTIRFSAYRWRNWTDDGSSMESADSMAWVCFSTHCSNSELVSFVNYLHPDRVEGFREPYVDSPRRAIRRSIQFETTPKVSPKKRPGDKKRDPNDRKLAPDVLKKLFG